MKNIPKIAHFYWGNKVLPYLHYLTLYSFKKCNPDWKVNLYVPKLLQPEMSWTSSEHKFPVNCKDYRDRIEDLGIEVISFDFDAIDVSNSLSEVLKSDFLRWYLLSTQGGLWADMDILFFRSISQISMNEKVNTVFCYQDGVWSVGFMMSSSNNPVFKHLHSIVCNNFNPKAYQSIGRVLLTHSFKNIRDIHTKFPNSYVHNLPMSIVYSIDSTRISYAYTTNHMYLLKSDTIGLHWYAGKQSLGHWINKIDENSYMKYDSILCNLIRRIVK